MEEHTIPLVPQDVNIDLSNLELEMQNVNSSIIYQTEYLTDSYYQLSEKLDNLLVSNILIFIVLIVTFARVSLGSAIANLRKSGKAVR